MAQTRPVVKMADIYRFLALSMRYPDPARMDGDYFDLLFFLLAELGWDEERAGLAVFSPPTAAVIEELRIEHTRLFINAVPHVPAPPYGSVYVGGGGCLYGGLAEKTRRFYRSCGYDLATASDLPDNLVHELQFLAFLQEEGREEEELQFLRELFRPWFGAFRDRVRREARHPFYRVLVGLIDFFTMEDD